MSAELISTSVERMAQNVEAAGAQLLTAQRADDEVGPRLLLDALQRYFEILKELEAQGGDALPAELLEELVMDTDTQSANPATTLGQYGISLLRDLIVRARDAHQAQACQTLERTCVAAALWTARHGGRLETLEPVVDALAELANTLVATRALAELAALMGEIADAVAPRIKQSPDSLHPGHPWRVLNVNRGIVATRSHDPLVMDRVFDALLRNLPDAAAEFFEEGMRQVEIIDYPPQVRDVMERYWRSTHARTLH
ncbi:MAG: hypothetical protein JSW10_13355 [Pseudomonadota bacterium]|nr:MAG: hypothetical protein JSW10_13355 [Pseudomonadota bacterium]